jgi:hypothetical protein
MVMDEPILLETQKSAIEALGKVIEEFRSGAAMEFIGIVIRPDGYRVIGGKTNDRHEMAGILLELAMERLDQGSWKRDDS